MKKLYYETFFNLQQIEKFLNSLSGTLLTVSVQKDIGTEGRVTGFIVYHVTAVVELEDAKRELAL